MLCRNSKWRWGPLLIYCDVLWHECGQMFIFPLFTLLWDKLYISIFYWYREAVEGGKNRKGSTVSVCVWRCLCCVSAWIFQKCLTDCLQSSITRMRTHWSFGRGFMEMDRQLKEEKESSDTCAGAQCSAHVKSWAFTEITKLFKKYIFISRMPLNSFWSIHLLGVTGSLEPWRVKVHYWTV